MVWWCNKHKCHSIDDLCPSCEREIESRRSRDRRLCLLAEAVGRYREEQEAPVRDATMIRLRRSEMFAALDAIDAARKEER